MTEYFSTVEKNFTFITQISWWSVTYFIIRFDCIKWDDDCISCNYFTANRSFSVFLLNIYHLAWYRIFLASYKTKRKNALIAKYMWFHDQGHALEVHTFGDSMCDTTVVHPFPSRIRILLFLKQRLALLWTHSKCAFNSKWPMSVSWEG